MSELFLTLVNMSITAGWLVLCVLLLRLLLKKAPKWLRVALWGLVGLRLALPLSIESVLSLIPSAETVSPGILYSETPAIQSGIPAVNSAVNPLIGGSFAPAAGASVNPLQIWGSVAAVVWLAGVAALLLYAAVSYLRLRSRVKTAVPLKENIYQSERVASPFVLGFFRPRIYLPFGMTEQAMENVVAHEKAHIKRRDHMIKPIGYLLLCVYWFNPLLWLAYILLCRDIELACDERVIRTLGRDERADYSEALLSCSVPHRLISACPLAFGEVGVKERVKNVLSYKKPAFWIVAAAVVACVVVALCFLTNPVTELSDKNMKAEAWPLAQSCAMANGVEINKNNAQLSRSGDGAAIEVLYPTNSEGEIRVIFAIDDGAIFSAVTVFEHAQLLLDDVMLLSHFGEELTWADFDAYDFVETGSGLYIRVYEIDGQFSLMIGGGSTEEPPMYIRLVSKANQDDYIDIRTEDVEAFIAVRQDVASAGGADAPAQLTPNADPLDAAVSAAILAHNAGEAPDGRFRCESHVTLATVSATPKVGANTHEVIVYAMVLYQEYDLANGGIRELAGSHVPTALTFAVDADGTHTLSEYWTPRDGSYYVSDIREKFPADIAAEALDTQKYILAQTQSCYAQAVAYGKVDTDAVIGQLLETITSSPAASSNPGDYIDAHPSEYRELTYYGDDTLRYVFGAFLQGGQTGLRGHILRSVMDDLIGGEALKLEAATGQEYFDAWRAHMEKVCEQSGADDLRETCPKGWLLLQMPEA